MTNRKAHSKVVALPVTLPYLPEGYTGQGNALAKQIPDLGPVLRAIESKQILSAQITAVDQKADTITVYLGDELGGLFGVMPSTEFDNRKYDGYQGFVGDVVDVILMEYLPKSGLVKVSRRQAREIKAAKTIEVLAPGQVVTAVVRRIKPYGIFLDVGGVDALLPVDEISHDFIGHPGDLGLFRLDAVQVQIKSIDKDDPNGPRIKVSLKALTNPWADITKRVKPGQIMLGEVVSIVGKHIYVKACPSVGVDILCDANGRGYDLHRNVRVEIIKVDTKGRKLRGRIAGLVAQRTS